MLDFHFITGMPRAGTTLLASLLRQNPRFYSHIESPTGMMFNHLLEAMSPKNEVGIFIEPHSRQNVLNYMMHGYYSGILDSADKVIFDNNRKWANTLPALREVFPNCHVFALVRTVAEVVESLERSYAENPLSLSVILKNKGNLTAYQRVKWYMDPDHGIVGWAINALKSGYFCSAANAMHIIKYNDLVTRPDKTLTQIHKIIGAEPFDYDFKQVAQIPGVEEFDRKIGAPGLHTLSPKVIATPQTSTLPTDLFQWLHEQNMPWDTH